MRNGLASEACRTGAVPSRRQPHALMPHQQAVYARLLQDLANGWHLSCVSGPGGSGKSALLQALSQAADHALTILVVADEPGSLLPKVFVALGLADAQGDSIAARRRLALRLSMAEQHGHSILILVDAAHQLTREDAGLLFHFFPPGHAAVVLAGAGHPGAWPAVRQAAQACTQTPRVHVLEPLAAPDTESLVPSRPMPPAMGAARPDPPVVDVRHRPSPRERQRHPPRWRTSARVLTATVLGAAAILFEWPMPVVESPAPASLQPSVETEASGPATSPYRVEPQPVWSSTERTPDVPTAEPPSASTEQEVAAASAEGAEPDTPATAAPSPPAAPEPTVGDTARMAGIAPALTPAPDPPAPAAARRAPEAAVRPAPAPSARPEIGRLYAERADYELGKSRLDEARLSVARGLAADPRNRRLLELRVVLRSAGSPNAPPLPTRPRQAGP